MVYNSSTYLKYKRKREGELNSIDICMQVTFSIRIHFHILIFYSYNKYWLKKKNHLEVWLSSIIVEAYEKKSSSSQIDIFIVKEGLDLYHSLSFSLKNVIDKNE